MKAFAAALLVSVADGSPCLCIFDVDSTLVGWATAKKCPKDQLHHLSDSGWDMLRSDAMLHLSDTFCGNCYLGVISAGSAGTEGGEERADITKYLSEGGKLPTDKWNPGGCKNKGSPLIVDCSNKPSAVPGILEWYKTAQGVNIADQDVHFFDDQDYNIITFEGHPYNAHQVSCPTDRPNTEATKCGAEVAELKNVSGKSYCCSGSQKLAPAPPSKCTTGCGVSCHFPFTYNGRSYNKCTTDGGDPAPWCATNSKYDGTHYGYCYGCPTDVRVNQTTSDVIV